MSYVAQDLAVTLLKSSTKYVAKRIERSYDRYVYRDTMKIIHYMFCDALSIKDAIRTVKEWQVEPQYIYSYFFDIQLFKRKNRKYESMCLAKSHALEILDSINKRFIAGLQDDCPRLCKYKPEEYTEDEGI